MRRRRGSSLAELVLVAWMFALVLAAVARFATAQGRLSAEQRDRTRAAEAVRAASLILEAELRQLTPSDVVAVAAESVRIRAMRGSGAVCGVEGAALLVRYRGVRLPNPAKDSLLLVTGSDGEERPHFAVTEVAWDAACGGALRLGLDVGPAGVPPPHAGLALIYETGAYHLSDGALRYRAGGAGRQPLTEAVFAGPGFRSSSAALSLSVEILDDSLPRRGGVRYDLPLYLLHRRTP